MDFIEKREIDRTKMSIDRHEHQLSELWCMISELKNEYQMLYQVVGELHGKLENLTNVSDSLKNYQQDL